MTTTAPGLARQALSAAALAGALIALASWGTVPLLAGVVALQLLLVLGVLALVDAPAAMGSFVIAVAASAAADVVVVVDNGAVAGLAGVAALAFVAALAHQLLRSHRSRVTESLADTLVAVVLALSAACLPAALQATDGEDTVRVALVAAGAALLVCRLSNWAARDGSFRLVTALTAGTLAGLPVAGDLEPSNAALVGLAAAAAVGISDAVVTAAAAETHDERRAAARRPVSLLLPFAVVGPVTLAAARLLAQA